MAEENHIEDLRETLSAAVFKIEGPINVMASVLATLERRGNGPAGSVLMEALNASRAARRQSIGGNHQFIKLDHATAGLGVNATFPSSQTGSAIGIYEKCCVVYQRSICNFTLH